MHPGEAKPTETTEDAMLERRLEKAAEGLLYLSEGEAPFTFVRLEDGGAGPLTPGTLRPLLSEPEGVPVEEVTLDRFFAGHIEEADAADPVAQQNRARFQHLKDVLRRELSQVRVFRVGETQKHCYILGRTPDGDLAGLCTTAYET